MDNSKELELAILIAERKVAAGSILTPQDELILEFVSLFMELEKEADDHIIALYHIIEELNTELQKCRNE